MKNIKLLLATTAILSAGALMANAGTSGIEEHADLKITAKILKSMNLNVEKDLDVGTIIWDWSTAGEGGPYLDITPKSDGSFTTYYKAVAFHDGKVQLGKICFNDILPNGAEWGEDFQLHTDNPDIYYNETKIGETDMGLRVEAAAESGKRCFYQGIQLSFYNNDTAKNFSGDLSLTADVTLIIPAN